MAKNCPFQRVLFFLESFYGRLGLDATLGQRVANNAWVLTNASYLVNHEVFDLICWQRGRWATCPALLLRLMTHVVSIESRAFLRVRMAHSTVTGSAAKKPLEQGIVLASVQTSLHAAILLQDLLSAVEHVALDDRFLNAGMELAFVLDHADVRCVGQDRGNLVLVELPATNRPTLLRGPLFSSPAALV